MSRPRPRTFSAESGFSKDYTAIVKDLDKQTKELNRSLGVEAREAEKAATATEKLARAATKQAAMATAILPSTLINLGGAFGTQASSLMTPGFLGAGKMPFAASTPWMPPLPMTSGWQGALPGQALGVSDILGQQPGFLSRAFGGGAGFTQSMTSTIVSALTGGVHT